MARKSAGNDKSTAPLPRKAFHLEWKNQAQKIGYMAFEQNDVLFLTGPAGTAKTHLAVAFACSETLSKKKKKIVLTRPIVEAGEKLGYLPGSFEEKINPFLMPIFDCLDIIVGRDTVERNKINQCMEIAPVAYLRGRTFHDSVVIFDEAQNATEEQLKLVMTRLGLNSKMVITGDPTQSDLKGDIAFPKIVESMKGVTGIGVVEFAESHIVRHPLVADILAAWPSK
jgi:phosphate starvation-inducible PhoH-like protein